MRLILILSNQYICQSTLRTSHSLKMLIHLLLFVMELFLIQFYHISLLVLLLTLHFSKDDSKVKLEALLRLNSQYSIMQDGRLYITNLDSYLIMNFLEPLHRYKNSILIFSHFFHCYVFLLEDHVSLLNMIRIQAQLLSIFYYEFLKALLVTIYFLLNLSIRKLHHVQLLVTQVFFSF